MSASGIESTDTAKIDAARRKRRRRWFIVIALVAAPFVLMAVWRVAIWWRVDQRVAALRDAGQPMSLVELFESPGPMPDPEINAAVLYSGTTRRYVRATRTWCPSSGTASWTLMAPISIRFHPKCSRRVTDF